MQSGRGNGPDLGSSSRPTSGTWREEVARNFVERKQTPADIRANRERTMRVDRPVFPIRLPHLPVSAALKERTSPSPPSLDSRPRSARSIRLESLASNTVLGPMPQLKPEVLYSFQPKPNDKLPLELFDDLQYLECDRTPQEWVELGRASGGTPARSPYFSGRSWTWEPCLVQSFDDETQEFTIKFMLPNNPPPKRVARLSLRFDAEDPEIFNERKAHCEQTRAYYESLRRLTDFVESQPNDTFAPIQLGTLQGITSKLAIDKEIITQARDTMISLLQNVNEEYARCMKASVVDYKRRHDPRTQAAVAHLDLPAPVNRPPAPQVGIVSIPVREYVVNVLVPIIAQRHFTLYAEPAQVLLTMNKRWQEQVRQGPAGKACFLIVDDFRLKLPLTLKDYQAAQDEHFVYMRDRTVEWRSEVINHIREQLHKVFKLFVNVESEYAASALKNYLKLMTLMMRTHIASLADESVSEYVAFFRRFAPRRKTLKADAGTEESAAASAETATQSDEPDFEDGGLAGFTSRSWDSPPPTLTGGVRPMFVFSLSADRGKVVFVPPLESISETLRSLISTPTKIASSLTQLDHEVVPLLRLPQTPIMTEAQVPEVYARVNKAKLELDQIVTANLYHPRQLAELYQNFAYLLSMEPEQYADKWFSTEAADLSSLTVLPRDTKPPAPVTHAHSASTVSLAASPAPSRRRATSTSQPPDASTLAAPAPVVDIEAQIQQIRSALALTRAEIARFFQAAAEIQAASPTQVHFRLLTIECEAVKRNLSVKASECAQRLLHGLAVRISTQNRRLNEELQTTLTQLRQSSKSVADMASLKALCKTVEQDTIIGLQREIKIQHEKLCVLDEFQYELSPEDSALSWRIVRFPVHLGEALTATKSQMAMDSLKFEAELINERTLFSDSMDQYYQDVEAFKVLGLSSANDTKEMEAHAKAVETLQDKLKASEELLASFHQRGMVLDENYKPSQSELRDFLDLKETFRPYFELWSVTQHFQGSQYKWMNNPFVNLDPQQIKSDVSSWLVLMARLEKELTAASAINPARVAFEMRGKIIEFAKHVPLITWLRHEGMQPRHWRELANILNAPILMPVEGQENTLTLKQIVSLNVEEHRDAIHQLSVSVQQEHVLDLSLDQMADDWSKLPLRVKPYKNTGTYTLWNAEALIALLDQHLLQSQKIRSSPYIQNFMMRARQWEEQLQKMFAIMEEWVKCQRSWILLEPIFSSEEGRQTQLRSFKTADKLYRQLLDQARKERNLRFFCDTENLLVNFKKTNQLLEDIIRGLNEYVEQKRIIFPRFNFLSNSELLTLLSKSKNVTDVQPYVSKCFQHVQSLEFVPNPGAEDSSAVLVAAFNGHDDDTFPFTEMVDPCTGPQRGNVELWFKDIELTMRTSLAAGMREAILDYYQRPRVEWALLHPTQCVLAVNQLLTTLQIEQTLATGRRRGLAALKEQLQQLMDPVAQMLRRTDLQPLQRTTLSLLSLQDVHVRDVMLHLIHNKTLSVTDAEWVSQLRMYLETGESLDAERLRFKTMNVPFGGPSESSGTRPKANVDTSKNDKKGRGVSGKGSAAAAPMSSAPAASSVSPAEIARLKKAKIAAVMAEAEARTQQPRDYVADLNAKLDAGSLCLKMGDAMLEYGYEFTGSSLRLVYTPVTERSYLNMLSALTRRFAPAADGPPGVGKSETMKDLAKTAAVHCVVVNCSEAITAKRSAAYVKGALSSGAWCLFDHFDLMNVQVLSVVAQQISIMHRALSERLKSTFFDTMAVSVNTSAAVLVTLSSATAANLPRRARLPDNLCHQLRIMAMTKPDFRTIAEISLTASGYKYATHLGKKMCLFLQLAQEQLSKAPQYDWGLRSLSRAIRLASQLKADENSGVALPPAPQEVEVMPADELMESMLVLRALCQLSFPMLSHRDIPLLQSVISDVFPDVPTDIPENEELVSAVTDSIKAMHLKAPAPFVEKCLELSDLVTSRQGVIIVGASFTGKSTAIKVVQSALSTMMQAALESPSALPSEEVKESKDGKVASTSDLAAHAGAAANVPHSKTDADNAAVTRVRQHSVQLVTINPVALGLANMFGFENAETGQFISGVAGSVIRSAVEAQLETETAKAPGKQWVVFDGPAESRWMENLNTLLDDNLQLSLASGEQIRLRPGVHILFETDNLDHASPSCVARCGVVHMEQRTLHDFRTIIDAFCSRHSASSTLLSPQHVTLVRDNLYWLLPPCLAFIRTAPTVVPAREFVVVRNLIALFESLAQSMINADEAFFKAEADAKIAREQSSAFTTAEALAIAGFDAAAPIAAPKKTRESRFRERGTDVEALLQFAVVWTFGSLIDPDQAQNHRARFAAFIHRLLTGTATSAQVFEVKGFDSHKQSTVPFPTQNVFDYVFDIESRSWQLWKDQPLFTSAYRLPSPEQRLNSSPFAQGNSTDWSSVIVSTVASVCVGHLVASLTASNHFTLLVGSPGTGKQTLVRHMVSQQLPENTYSSLSIALSAHSGSASTQQLIESVLERRAHNALGAIGGADKRCVVFVDDINLPRALEVDDVIGAGPASSTSAVIELLRQWADQGGWWATPKATAAAAHFDRLVDVQLVGAMAPVGFGGRALPERFAQHLFAVGLAVHDSATLQRIFSTIINGFFSERLAEGKVIVDSVYALRDAVVSASVDLHQDVCSRFRPLLSAPQIAFELRDLRHVILGIVGASFTSIKEPRDLARLWVHESSREYSDRFTSEAEQQTFKTALGKQLITHFKIAVADVLDGQPLWFADFGYMGAKAAAYKGEYTHVAKPKAILDAFTRQLDEHNRLVNKRPMPLVMFQTAVQYVLRVARVLHRPRGHALLIGSTGAGRRDLTRMAAMLETMEVVQIDASSRTFTLKEWRASLAALLNRAGVAQEKLVFHFSDTFVQPDNELHATILNDVATLLTHGALPNLFTADELTEMTELLLPAARNLGGRWADSRTTLIEYFAHCCAQNLRIVVSLERRGSDDSVLRQRLAAYPVFLSACTPIFFQNWNEESLKNVAEKMLSDLPLDLSVKQSVVQSCVALHSIVAGVAADFDSEQRQAGSQSDSVSPALVVDTEKYLELVKTYRMLLDRHRTNITKQQHRYINALDKINELNEAIINIREELVLLKPELAQSGEHSDQLARDIDEHSAQIAIVTEAIAAQSRSNEMHKETVDKIKEEIATQMDKLVPALDAAVKGVALLKKSQLDDLKQMKVVTPGISLTMAGVCILFGVEPRKAGAANRRDDDYWEPAKKRILDDGKIGRRVELFERDTIPEDVSAKLRPLLANANFDVAKISTASPAAGAFAKWVSAVEKYDKARTENKLKREQLLVSEGSLDVGVNLLAEKQTQLAKLQSQLTDLQAALNSVGLRRHGMEEQTVSLTERLARAEKLVEALTSEKDAWITKADELRQALLHGAGNMLVSAAYIAYLGPLPQAYRERAVSELTQVMSSCQPPVPVQADAKLSSLLGDAIELKEWELFRLPVDDMAADNAVIWKHSRKWPLFIDPQDQAVQWIKALEEDLAQQRDLANKERGIDKKKNALSGLQIIKACSVEMGADEQQAVRATLISCMELGLPVLIEGVVDTLDPLFEPLLTLRNITKQPMNSMLKLAEGLTPLPSLKAFKTRRMETARTAASASEGADDGVDVVQTEESKADVPVDGLPPDGTALINFAGEARVCHPEFRLYFTTKCTQSQLDISSASKLCAINFAVTPKSLTHQMVVRLLGVEEPLVDTERSELCAALVRNAAHAHAITDRMLDCFSAAVGSSVVDDEELVNELHAARTAAKDTEERQKKDAAALVTIQMKVQDHQGGATMAVFYFALVELSRLNPMYHWSLSWFLDLFAQAARDAAPAADATRRTDLIKRSLLSLLQQHVMRGLLEPHRLYFALLLCVRIAEAKGEVKPRLVRFLFAPAPESTLTPQEAAEMLYPLNPASQPEPMLSLSVPSGVSAAPASPPEEANWLSDVSWRQLVILDKVIGGPFAGIVAHWQAHLALWRAWAIGTDVETKPLPGPFEKALNGVQKLTLLRCIRPAQLYKGACRIVSHMLGSAYAEATSFDLARALDDSAPTNPIIVYSDPALSLSGVPDTLAEIARLAEERDMKGDNKLSVLSLGQGTAAAALHLIREGVDKGLWVVLQNGHLVPDFFPFLLKELENINLATVAPEFRLWIVTEVTSSVPPALLESGIKIVAENPTSLKQALLTIYKPLSDTFFELALHSEPLRKLAFALAFLHGVALRRHNFQPLGWASPHAFTAADLNTSFAHIYRILEAAPLPPSQPTLPLPGMQASAPSHHLPVRALRAVLERLTYGRALVDQFDVRLLNSLVEDLISERVLTVDQADLAPVTNVIAPPPGSAKQRRDSEAHAAAAKAASKGFFMPPNESTIPQFVESIEAQFPREDDPVALGFNPDIAKSIAMRDSAALLSFFSFPSSSPVSPPASPLASLPVSASRSAAIATAVSGCLRVLVPSAAPAPDSNRSVSAPPAADGKSDAVVSLFPPGDFRHASAAATRLSVVSLTSSALLNLDLARQVFPVGKHEQSAIHSVLLHEIANYNQLLQEVLSSLYQLQAVASGAVMSTPELEELATALLAGKIPASWMALSFASNKPLLAWLSDLQQHVAWFKSWIESKANPAAYWISAFYEPGAFLSAARLVYARSANVPLDDVRFDTSVPVDSSSWNWAAEPLHVPPSLNAPDSGVLVYGLFLQGAQWSTPSNSLVESSGLTSLSPVPLMHFTPRAGHVPATHPPSGNTANHSAGAAPALPNSKHPCELPVYRTTRRSQPCLGWLRPRPPIKASLPSALLPVHWLKRGAALVTQTDM